MRLVTTFALGILLALTLLTYEAWVLSYLWFWFIATPFSTIVVSIPNIIGLLLIKNIALFKAQDIKMADPIKVLIGMLSVTTISLVVGWLINIFLM